MIVTIVVRGELGGVKLVEWCSKCMFDPILCNGSVVTLLRVHAACCRVRYGVERPGLSWIEESRMSESVSTRRVLLVDDEAHILHVVAMKLRGAGFDVHTAGDGEEGLAAAQELQPDLVVSDLQMPFMDGVELAQALKCDPSLSEIPVLMLTARGFSIPKAELERTNVVAVLSKPFSPREVLAKVEELTSRVGGQAGAA